jgi:Cobalamin adenosyltransferase
MRKLGPPVSVCALICAAFLGCSEQSGSNGALAAAGGAGASGQADAAPAADAASGAPSQAASGAAGAPGTSPNPDYSYLASLSVASSGQLGAALSAETWADGEALRQIQSDLFTVGAELACVPGKEDKLRMTPVAEADITRLEGWIDRSEAVLDPARPVRKPARIVADG